MKRSMIIGVMALLVGAFGVPSSSLADLDSGLVAYWSFDEGSGDTAHDYSGNGNHGMIYGASWTAGKYGYALEFDGVDDYVSLDEHVANLALDITDDYTVAGWFRTVTEYSAPMYHMADSEGASPGFTAVQTQSGYIEADVQNGVNWIGASSDVCNDGNWHHYAAVYHGHPSTPSIELYFDGGFIDADTGYIPSFSASDFDYVKMGRVAHHPSQYYDGVFDEVRIYNRTLCEAQIEALYVGVEDGMSAFAKLPQAFLLSQNYPNPFNPITEIRYALAKDSQVRLEIYKILGQKVATLIDEKQTAGYKSVHWDSRSQTGNEVSSGIYFYRLQAGDFIETKRMILLR